MIISRSAEETFEIARRYAESLRAGDVVGLVGDLGAGKTQFVKGMAAGLAVTAAVTSPTFALVQEYPGKQTPLYHIDLYRLDSAEETVRIGLDDYLHGDGVAAVEWADKFPELMPDGTRWIFFRATGDAREIELDAKAPGAVNR